MKSLSMFAAAAAIAAGSLAVTSSADARTVARHGHRHVYGAFGSVPYIGAIPYLGRLPYLGAGGFYGRSYGGPWGHTGPSDNFQFQGDYD
jgi:hypothetical protein